MGDILRGFAIGATIGAAMWAACIVVRRFYDRRTEARRLLRRPPADDRTVKQAVMRNEFDYTDSGDVAFWPNAHRGYLTAVELRMLADELDRRNS